jgi:hypothetical protein
MSRLAKVSKLLSAAGIPNKVVVSDDPQVEDDSIEVSDAVSVVMIGSRLCVCVKLKEDSYGLTQVTTNTVVAIVKNMCARSCD